MLPIKATHREEGEDKEVIIVRVFPPEAKGIWPQALFITKEKEFGMDYVSTFSDCIIQKPM